MIRPAPRGLGLKNPVIGWKKTYKWYSWGRVPVLVMLQILGPYTVGAFDDDGTRTSKRRTSKALVLAQFQLEKIVNYDASSVDWKITDRFTGCSVSGHDSTFKYRVGAIVEPTEEFERSNMACAPGVHFFADIEEAMNY